MKKKKVIKKRASAKKKTVRKSAKSSTSKKKVVTRGRKPAIKTPTKKPHPAAIGEKNVSEVATK